MNLLLEAMVKKLSYTATLELVPLMEVPGVKQVNRDLLLSLPNKGPFRELFLFWEGDAGGLYPSLSVISRLLHFALLHFGSFKNILFHFSSKTCFIPREKAVTLGAKVVTFQVNVTFCAKSCYILC